MAIENRKSKNSFTLIELLVVIAIIMLLAAMLLPSLRRAREVSKQTVCGANLRQISLAAFSYATDCSRFPQEAVGGLHEKAYPNWIVQWVFDALQKYGANDGTWKCPTNPILQKNYYAGGGGWQPFTVINYVWIAEGQNLQGTSGWGSLPSSITGYPDSASYSDDSPSTHIMAADCTMWYSSGWWQINHPQYVMLDGQNSCAILQAQMTVYGDGHLRRQRLGDDRLPATLVGNAGASPNWRFCHWAGSQDWWW